MTSKKNTDALRAVVDEYCSISQEINALEKKKGALKDVIKSSNWFEGHKFAIVVTVSEKSRLDVKRIRAAHDDKWITKYTITAPEERYNVSLRT